MHELPLVFFTVLGQSAVGLVVLAFIAAKTGHINQQQLNRANLIAAVIAAVGMAVGGTHMGQPLRAMNLMFGAVRSPMSNEILLSGAFFGLLAVTAGLGIAKLRAIAVAKLGESKTDTLQSLANLGAAVSGIAFAWSITQVYQLETVPAWNSGYTSLQLWLTVLVAGGALAMAIGAHKIGGIAVIAGSAIALATRSGYIDFVTETVPHLASQQFTFWNSYIAAVLIALLIALLTLVRRRALTPLLFTGAAVMVAGELAGRIAFYNLWWITM